MFLQVGSGSGTGKKSIGSDRPKITGSGSSTLALTDYMLSSYKKSLKNSSFVLNFNFFSYKNQESWTDSNQCFYLSIKNKKKLIYVECFVQIEIVKSMKRYHYWISQTENMSKIFSEWSTLDTNIPDLK